MKLHVVFISIHAGVTEHGMTPPKRLVTIDLTPEQMELLRPRQIGRSHGLTNYESIDQAFLDAEEGNNDQR